MRAEAEERARDAPGHTERQTDSDRGSAGAAAEHTQRERDRQSDSPAAFPAASQSVGQSAVSPSRRLVVREAAIIASRKSRGEKADKQLRLP